MSDQIAALKEFMRKLSASGVDHLFVMFPFQYKDNAYITKMATYRRMVTMLKLFMENDEHFFPALREALDKFIKENDTDHKAMQDLLDDVNRILNQSPKD